MMEPSRLGKSNPRINELRELMASSRERTQRGRCVVEGPKVIGDLIARGTPPIEIFVREGAQGVQDVLRASERFQVPLFELPSDVFDRLASSKTPQGVLATFDLPIVPELEQIAQGKRDLFILVDIQDPGNVGTLVRTAAASGLGGAILTTACADAFSPKVVRASAGAVFQLPLRRENNIKDVIARLRNAGYGVFGTAARGGVPFTKADLSGPIAIVLGSEGVGLSESDLGTITGWLQIPVQEGVESLNVAIAGSLIAFEARRQKSE